MGCGTSAVYAAWVAELWLYMPHGLWNLGRICRIDCGSRLYATWTAEFRRRASHVENLITVPLQPPRHNVPHPIPKHTDKSQHRTPHHNPRTQNPLGTTFHIQHRSIQTKVSTVSHTTTQELLKKSLRGVQRGRGFTAPLRFSTASQSKKTRPSAKQESKNKTKNQPHNKQRKRKSQRKIKKKNKRKNKGEKA